MDIVAVTKSPGFPLTLGRSRFYASESGELCHEIDGAHRATVPPEGWEAYEAEWPACAPLLKQLRGKGAKK
jgi:hypothetical protein